MIFLIHYNRTDSKLEKIAEFEDRNLAAQARSDLEIELLGCEGLREIVLFEADSLEALKKTHSRYFNSLDELAKKRQGTGNEPRN